MCGNNLDTESHKSDTNRVQNYADASHYTKRDRRENVEIAENNCFRVTRILQTEFRKSPESQSIQ